MIVQFKNQKCIVEIGLYDNDYKAIILIDATNGERVITATTNVAPSGAKITDKDHVYIKDYSENTGTVVALKEANVIEHDITNQFYATFVTINEYKLTPKALKLWK